MVKNVIFVTCWLFIAAVASFDTAATSLLHTNLQHGEENPVARLVLQAHDWQVATFLGIKMFGTILVLGFLAVAKSYRPKHALAIAIILAVFQALFLFYTFQ